MFSFLCAGAASAQSTGNSLQGIIPKPKELKPAEGVFRLNSETQIVINDAADSSSAIFLRDFLSEHYHISVSTCTKQPADNFILLNTLKFIRKPDNEEHYKLSVTSKGVHIEGDSYRGTFLGVQTFIQLLPTVPDKRHHLPVTGTSIDDAPMFAYRGMHLDVARHFFPVDFIKKYIDLLALHKFNNFHWHLTDDQGWRIEIKKCPKLTGIGSCRKGTIIGRYPGTGNDGTKHCGFYTQEEVKEVIRYASERFINIIPEIEMPGHASAAIASYPYLSCFPNKSTPVPYGTHWHGDTAGKKVQQTWGVFEDVFCAGKESTFTFLQDVLDEVIALFPSQYIHIGGDECPKTHWKQCPQCQQRIKDLGIKDEQQLQSYFVKRMGAYVESKGKRFIGWDEILEGGLAPNAVVMSWRGEQGGIQAAREKHQVIMTPESHVYFDFSQSKNNDSVTRGRYLPLEKVYNYQPIPRGLQGDAVAYIIGGQGNLWTEYINNPAKAEYQLLPRLSALGEVLWSKEKDYASFEQRLEAQFLRYEKWGYNYSRAHQELRFSTAPSRNGVTLQFFTDYKRPHYITVKQPGKALLRYKKPVEFSATSLFEATLVDSTSKKVISQVRDAVTISKATGRNVSLSSSPSSAYPGEGGATGLVNGIKARQFNSTEWQGWFAKDVSITIDLGRNERMKKIVLGTWQQEPSYIFIPAEVLVETSTNRKTWKHAGRVKTKAAPTGRLDIAVPVSATARYVRITAKNGGTVPAGRPNAGGKTWVFIDEVEVR